MIIENSMQILSLIWWISVKVSPFCSAQHWFDTGYVVQTSWDRIIPLRLPVSPSTHEPMSPVEWTQLALIDSICGCRHFYLIWIVLDFVPQCNSCNIQLDSKAMYERNVNFIFMSQQCVWQLCIMYICGAHTNGYSPLWEGWGGYRTHNLTREIGQCRDFIRKPV